MKGKLTPFEQAQANQKMHPARMKLCAQVNALSETLEEIQKLAKLSPDDLMYDEDIVVIAKEEEAKIMQQLIMLADIWENTEGVSA